MHFRSAAITSDDYPPDLILTLLQGRSLLEFGIAASGNATDLRILIADPAFAFDAIALAKGTTITYEPARSNGVPRACRGATQAVTWQMPQ